MKREAYQRNRKLISLREARLERALNQDLEAAWNRALAEAAERHPLTDPKPN